MIFATKENLAKQIIFTKHAKQRIIQYDIKRGDLIAMLYSSELRPLDERRMANKRVKHGEFHYEWWINNMTIVTAFEGKKCIIITVHRD